MIFTVKRLNIRHNLDVHIKIRLASLRGHKRNLTSIRHKKWNKATAECYLFNSYIS